MVQRKGALELTSKLRELAYLNSGLEIVIVDERTGTALLAANLALELGLGRPATRARPHRRTTAVLSPPPPSSLAHRRRSAPEPPHGGEWIGWSQLTAES